MYMFEMLLEIVSSEVLLGSVTLVNPVEFLKMGISISCGELAEVVATEAADIGSPQEGSDETARIVEGVTGVPFELLMLTSHMSV